jgi:deoxyribose-phosphate aldolase
MDFEHIFTHIDHTMLGPCGTMLEIESLCKEAIENNMASVCIPPAFVKRAKDVCGDKITICTVIGFPLGYNTTETKLFEAKDAIANSADEIDMVINLGDVKEGNFSSVKDEIKNMKEVCGNKILKVIIETCFLTQEEKETLCQCVTEAGADFIKTSTGFGTSGAAIEDIELFKKNIGPEVKIKASGGVRTYEDFVRYIEAGCERIGTSSAMKVLKAEHGGCTQIETRIYS